MTPSAVSVTAADTETASPPMKPGWTICAGDELQENAVKSPYSTLHTDSMHAEPDGQTRHEGPQASSSAVVSVHSAPHKVNPLLQVTSQVVPAHISVASASALHDAQAPPQQIWSMPQPVPSGALRAGKQVACPPAHEMVPVWQTSGGLPGLHSAPAVQDEHKPPRQVRPAPQPVPLARSPVRTHVACPALHDVVPVSHGFPFGSQSAPDTQGVGTPPSLGASDDGAERPPQAASSTAVHAATQ
jgi:hypothetical protein